MVVVLYLVDNWAIILDAVYVELCLAFFVVYESAMAVSSQTNPTNKIAVVKRFTKTSVIWSDSLFRPVSLALAFFKSSIWLCSRILLRKGAVLRSSWSSFIRLFIFSISVISCLPLVREKCTVQKQSQLCSLVLRMLQWIRLVVSFVFSCASFSKLWVELLSLQVFLESCVN